MKRVTGESKIQAKDVEMRWKIPKFKDMQGL